jgi:predicted NBD/HSP70 family sugar kinase
MAAGRPLRPGEQQIVAALRNREGVSRRQLSVLTGLPASTLTANVAGLLTRGLLSEEDDPAAPRRGAGRPATTLRIALPSKTVAAIQLGRTRQAFTFVGFDGRIQQAAPLDLDLHQPLPAIATDLARVLDRCAPTRSDAVVISVAMPFRQGAGTPPIPIPAPDRTGRPRVNRPSWLQTDPSQALTETLGIPVLVENDANVAALGEAGHGAARGAHIALYLNIATGFGAGIIIDGRLLRGAHGVAGELAHVSIREDGDICLCGNRGCMTTLRRNGPGMADELTTALGRKPSMEEIIALAGTQDITVSRWLADLGRNVAQSLIGFVTLLNPDLIVVDADLGPAAFPLANGLRETLLRRTPPMTHHGLRVVPGELKHTSIALGSATLATQHHIDALLAHTSSQ